MNNSKLITKLLFLTFFYSFALYSCQNNNFSTEEISFTPTDTISISGNSCKKQIFYYNKESNSNILSYFNYTRNSLVQISNKKNIKEIDFNKLFNKPGKFRLMQHFFYLNKNNDIYLLATPVNLINSNNNKLETKRDYFLFRIDSTNQITDTIEIVNNTNKNFYIQSPLYQLPIISNEDSSVFISAVAITAQPGEKLYNDYQVNNNSRLKSFSQDCSMLIVIKNDREAYFMTKDISYPKIFLDTNISFYNYFPSIVGNANQNILTIYRDLDTLYSYNVLSNSYFKYQINSKYNTPFIPFEKTKLFDYEYLYKYSAESCSYLYLKQNRVSNQTYVIIKKPIKYENDDGTVNNPSKNPFSVIVLDSNYSQIGEFDIPPEYIKHHCFAYGNGIAFLNSKLLEKDTNNNLHFVIFETKTLQK